MQNTTIVSGYWHIRKDRLESTYLDNFKNILNLSNNMIIFSPEKYHDFILDNRSNKREQTVVIKTELSDIQNNYFSDYWKNVQTIRTNVNWINSTNWLPKTPQCFSEWYNPIVMSKVFFIRESYEKNPFNSDSFMWIDAGITQHIPSTFITDTTINNIAGKLQKVLFTSFDYTGTEIHGFDYTGYKKYTSVIPDWLCRATIFGCHKNYVDVFVSDYSNLLNDTLQRGYMGTEESILTLLSCINPALYIRHHTKNEQMPFTFLKEMSSEKV
jgi:hypothetical protein